MSVLLLAVGLACQHWIMLLADVARTSNQVSGTSSRLSKVSLIAGLLQQCAQQVVDGTAPADEVGLATRYLSGSLRQRRTGIELSSLSGLPPPPEPGVVGAGQVTVSELDSVMQQASELSGAGSSRVRADLFLSLVRRLTAQERVLVLGLLRGGLHQGALESVVMTAVAQAGGVALEDVRRAVAAQGNVPGVAQTLLVNGPGAVDLFRLTVGRSVAPMLASSAKSVAEALAKSGPASAEWKLDGIRAQIHKQGNDIHVLTRSLDDITDRVPEVVKLIAALPAMSAVFDGELIALHSDGRPKPFQETGSRAASRVDPTVARAQTPLTAFLFDVLHLDGSDLIDEPARVRRSVLENAVPLSNLTPRFQVDNVAEPAQVDAATAFAADAVARGRAHRRLRP
jgi:DNA ligase-1